jgi:hypothetical protein
MLQLWSHFVIEETWGLVEARKLTGNYVRLIVNKNCHHCTGR